MYTHPRIPNPERCVKQGDGSYLMTLLPSDPDPRMEWCFGAIAERLPVGVRFMWRFEIGLVESTVPLNHEWIMWQWHTPDELKGGANPFLRMLVRNGVGYLQATHEYSVPYNKPTQKQVELATVDLVPGRMYVWDIDAIIANDGMVKIRRDGVLVADYVGPLGYDFTGMPGPYAKAGIYKWVRDWAGKIVIKIKP